MSVNKEVIKLGIIGCGNFGLFALQHFLQVDGVKLAGMAGTYRESSKAAAKRYGIDDIVEVEELVKKDLDLIYITTPPFLHHPQAMLALKAGKHVISEKPLALTLTQADEMLATAKKKNLLMVANLMQRYNPLTMQVQQLIEKKLLGEPLHGYFENYASDEGLPKEHWFWDRKKSGGLFVEHGVHFFDLFASWFGKGKVLAAQKIVRPRTDIEEQMQCTVRYQNVLVNFYHGFHQANRMDRQELRLVFERGEITLYGWIPTGMRLHAIADEKTTRELCELFSGSKLNVTDLYAKKDRLCRARHKSLDVYHKIALEYGFEKNKMTRYGELLRAIFSDQIAWIRGHYHQRLITEKNGRASLALAIEADRLAH